MISKSLKVSAAKGILWSVLEKVGVRGGQFAIGIVLARILNPKDFGLISMLTVFMNISVVLVESGLGKGLIQKKNRTSIDYSTVFVFNLVVSVAVYFFLYLLSPFVAIFYKTPELTNVLRVLSLNIIFISLSIVQITKLTIDINFKSIALVNFVSMLLSGSLALFLAYEGLGVWSLVVLHVSRTIFSLLLYWMLMEWKISLRFSRESFNGLFGFGSKLLLASVYSHAINNIYNIVIGKSYSATDLGYYSRAKSFTETASDTISSIVQQVSFPLLASLQDDKEKFVGLFKQSIRVTAFIIFPTMTLLSLLGSPLVMILLNEKWLFVIPLLQWMAFTRFLYPLSIINMNVLNATGRSDLFLKLDLVKFPIVVIPMIIALFISVKAMVIAQVLVSFISFFINAYIPGKMYKYGSLSQLRDLWPIIVSTLFMAMTVYGSIYFIDTEIGKITLGTLVASVSYLLFSYIFKVSCLNEIRVLLSSLQIKKTY